MHSFELALALSKSEQSGGLPPPAVLPLCVAHSSGFGVGKLSHDHLRAQRSVHCVLISEPVSTVAGTPYFTGSARHVIKHVVDVAKQHVGNVLPAPAVSAAPPAAPPIFPAISPAPPVAPPNAVLNCEITKFAMAKEAVTITKPTTAFVKDVLACFACLSSPPDVIQRKPLYKK